VIAPDGSKLIVTKTVTGQTDTTASVLEYSTRTGQVVAARRADRPSLLSIKPIDFIDNWLKVVPWVTPSRSLRVCTPTSVGSQARPVGCLAPLSAERSRAGRAPVRRHPKPPHPRCFHA
jgi:hypothetical protein